jgi:hypothetical protein
MWVETIRPAGEIALGQRRRRRMLGVSEAGFARRGPHLYAKVQTKQRILPEFYRCACGGQRLRASNTRCQSVSKLPPDRET